MKRRRTGSTAALAANRCCRCAASASASIPNVSKNPTCDEATKPSNAIDAKTNIELQAIFTRKYPELEIGRNVKIYKKKTLGQKERVSKFLTTVYIISNITEKHGQKYYNLQGITRPYLRVELLKV